MRNLTKLGLKASLLASSVLPFAAYAQSVSLTYVPLGGGADATSVPTMTEWVMVLMSVVIAVFAVRQIKRKGISKSLLPVLLAASFLGAAVSDGSFVKVANAVAIYRFDTPAGSSFTATVFPNNPGGLNVFTTNDITNTTAVTFKITAETGSGACFGSFDAGTNTCAVNSIIAPGASCKVGIINPC